MDVQHPREMTYPSIKMATNELCGRIWKTNHKSCEFRLAKISHVFIEQTVANCITRFVESNGYKKDKYLPCSIEFWDRRISDELLEDVQFVLSEYVRKKQRFKNIIYCVVLLNSAYYDTVEKLYKPGGMGMLEAEVSFNSNRLIQQSNVKH